MVVMKRSLRLVAVAAFCLAFGLMSGCHRDWEVIIGDPFGCAYDYNCVPTYTYCYTECDYFGCWDACY